MSDEQHHQDIDTTDTEGHAARGKALEQAGEGDVIADTDGHAYKSGRLEHAGGDDDAEGHHLKRG